MKALNYRTYQTKQALREAMRTAVVNSGFESLTIHTICAMAPVSRTTFYIYYRDKYDLMVDYVRQTLFYTCPVKIDEDPELYFAYVLQAVRKDDLVFRRITGSCTPPELKQRMEAMCAQQLGEYFESLPGEREGDPFAQMDKIYHCSGCIQLILWWQSSRYPVPVDEMAAHLAAQLRQIHPLPYRDAI